MVVLVRGEIKNSIKRGGTRKRGKNDGRNGNNKVGRILIIKILLLLRELVVSRDNRSRIIMRASIF